MSSIRNFGDAFSPLQWKGFRALQFHEDEDAFQQLVGDALKCQFLDRVFVATSQDPGALRFAAHHRHVHCA